MQLQLPVTELPKITGKTPVSSKKISEALSAASLTAAGAMPLVPGASGGSAQVNLGQQESFIQLPQTPRTGRQIIQHFVPDWQEKLLSTKLFTPEELALVEQALINMDEYFYEISEDGQKVWLITEEWDYENQFSHELEFTFKDISPEQKERIMGAGHAFGVLRPALLLVTLQNHVLVYEKVPPFPKTPVSRWANALVQLVRKGEKTDAFSLQVLDIYQANIKRIPAPKTDETWLAEYKANPEEFYNNSTMYHAFYRAEQYVRTAEANGTSVPKIKRRMSAIYRKNARRYGVWKTSEEWVAEYETHPGKFYHGSSMYIAFVNADQDVKAAEKKGMPISEAKKRMSAIFRENTQRRAVSKTDEEWLAEYETHPEEFYYGSSMYNAFYRAELYVRNAEKNGTPVPETKKRMADIYRQNAKRYRVRKTSEEMSDIYRANTQHRAVPKSRATPKTDEDWLAEYKAHPEKFYPGSNMYKVFEEAYRKVRFERAYRHAKGNGPSISAARQRMADIFLKNTKR